MVEKDYSDILGGGADIWLYDLATRELAPLTTDRQSTMPRLDGDMVVWKIGPRYQGDPINAIFSLVTRQVQLVRNPQADVKNGLPNDPQLAGHRLYWKSSALLPVYIHDLNTHKTYEIASPGAGENIGAVALSDTMVAWSRALDFGATRSDYVLQWRTLP